MEAEGGGIAWGRSCRAQADRSFLDNVLLMAILEGVCPICGALEIYPGSYKAQGVELGFKV